MSKTAPGKPVVRRFIVCSSDESIKSAAEVVNQDLVTEKKGCCKWSMLIAADKTEVMIFSWNGRQPVEPVPISMVKINPKSQIQRRFFGWY